MGWLWWISRPSRCTGIRPRSGRCGTIPASRLAAVASLLKQPGSTGYISLMPTNKALGQHWLRDRVVLANIAELAQIEPTDTVLEIGPGLGTLTSELLRRAKRVVAVEFDAELARKLPG